MVERSQFIRIENPLHKHFPGMPMVEGLGSKIVKICRRLKWMVQKLGHVRHCVQSSLAPRSSGPCSTSSGT